MAWTSDPANLEAQLRITAITTQGLVVQRIARTGTVALIALSVTAHAAESTDTPIPKAIQALLSPQDTVVALKTAEPLGAEPSGTVIVVHHAGTKSSEGNPCEIMLLRPSDSGFVVVARNSRVVHCSYDEYPTRARALGVQDNLTVKPIEITYFNELARGGTTYSFAWSNGRSAWHLQRVEAVTVRNGDDDVIIYKTLLEYPLTLPWITLSDFDPDNLLDRLMKHRRMID